MTEKLTIEKVLEMAGVELSAIAIAQHEQGYMHLIVRNDGGDAGFVESLDSTYRNDEWTSLLTVGTGSIGCNCDGCEQGHDPADWAGEEVSHLEDQISFALISFAK